MTLICSYCGRDIDAIGQDNMSDDLEHNMCEDCWLERQSREFVQNNPGSIRWASYTIELPGTTSLDICREILDELESFGLNTDVDGDVLISFDGTIQIEFDPNNESYRPRENVIENIDKWIVKKGFMKYRRELS